MSHLDERLGHFVTTDGRWVGADMGDRLWLDRRSGIPAGAPMTPDQARELAGALTWWADREHGDERGDEAFTEAFDLLELLDRQTAKEAR